MLYRGEFDELKKKLFQLNIICCLLSLFFLCILLITFGYLQIKSLSFIPILSLLILAVSLVLMTLNLLRYNIIKKVISGEFKIDREFLRLLIIGFKASVVTERSDLEIECHDCMTGCMNKKEN